MTIPNTLEETHAYNVEISIIFLNTIESILTLRARGNGITDRERMITDDETASTLPTVWPLIAFAVTTLGKSNLQSPRERELAIRYAELVFSDVYLGWFFDRKLAISIIDKIHLSPNERKNLWDRVETLVDDIYDDFHSNVFREQRRQILSEISEYQQRANN